MACVGNDSYVLPEAFSQSLGNFYSKSFKCFHLNVQSVNNKQSDLSLFFEQLNHVFDVIMLTETWSTDEASVFRLPSYNTFYLNRISGRGGGVCILVKKVLDCDLIQNFTHSCNDFEFLSVKLQNVVLAVCYRPPNGETASFLDYLDTFFAFTNTNRLDVVCGGDMNINMLKQEAIVQKLDILLKSHCFSNMITVPTRITQMSSSLIDLFLTNIPTENLKAGVITVDLSDHLPIYICCRKHLCDKNKPNTFFTQRINEQTLKIFSEKILRAPWTNILKMNEPNKAYEEFLNILKPIYTASFPLVKTKQNRKVRKLWINAELRKRIQEKNMLFSRYLKTKDPKLFKEFKVKRNRLNKDLKKAKQEYYNNMFSSVSGCSDIMWKRLNSLLNRNVSTGSVHSMNLNGEVISGKPLADTFNKYFVNVAEKCDVSSNLGSVPFIDSTIFLDPTSENEVKELVLNLKNSTALDIDGIQVQPIKHVIIFLLPYITHIFNLCLGRAVFPTKMQVARVTVLFKKGDRNNMSNYRPVSILPVLSKALEKLILKRLTNFERKFQLLHDSQYGFRKGFSTEYALMAQKEYIYQQFEQGNVVLGLFVDFTKAFDHINHKLLIEKLERYGIRGTAGSLIQSYLQHRNQIVSLGGCNSDSLSIVAGVPQGSILGPFLFNIYINDIVNISSNVKFIIYADDTNIFLTGKSVNELITHANLLLIRLEKWTRENGLKINVAKTKAMVFHAKNKAEIVKQTIFLNSTPVEIVPSLKILGVIFQETLSWDHHIHFLATKVSQVVGLVYRNKHLLPRNILLLIYNTLFLSRINYCHLVWALTSKENINKLHMLQKRFVRAVENVPRTYHTRSLFEKYNLMPVIKMYDFLLSKKYKQDIKNSNPFLKQLADLILNQPKYNTRKNEVWTVRTFRTTYGLQSLGNKLPRLLNELRDNEIDLEKITFKQLRNHFLQTS